MSFLAILVGIGIFVGLVYLNLTYELTFCGRIWLVTISLHEGQKHIVFYVDLPHIVSKLKGKSL